MTDQDNYPIQTCQWCGDTVRLYFNDDVIMKLQDQKACHGCGFWMDRIDHDTGPAAEHYVVTQDFEHYLIGEEDGGERFRGFGGAPFIVEWFDKDRTAVFTTNLWSQGSVPEIWRERFTPNAKILSARMVTRER